MLMYTYLTFFFFFLYFIYLNFDYYLFTSTFSIAITHKPLLHGLLSPRMTTLELTANSLFYCLHSLLPFPLCN